MEIKEIHKNILGYSAHDDMGLWIIPRNITNSETIKMDPEDLRHETLAVIQEMLENGLIEIGVMIPKNGAITYQPLSLSTIEAVAFIEQEWMKLGRSPDIGEICWFRATPAGEKLAEELGLED